MAFAYDLQHYRGISEAEVTTSTCFSTLASKEKVSPFSTLPKENENDALMSHFIQKAHQHVEGQANRTDEEIFESVNLLKNGIALKKPIKKLLCANRGEIAVRIIRAAHALGLRTVAIYSHEDRASLHRYKSTESYPLPKNLTPVGSYLDIPSIIKIAKDAEVDIIHPGYGFLSENQHFAEACKEAGILFCGPSPDVIKQFGDKTTARNAAKAAGIPIVPGSDGPVDSVDAAVAFVEANGLPIIMKAAFGGGGRGMRVVRKLEDLKEAFERCSSEAKSAFGDGTLFIERYIERPRHIEVQILGDMHGNVVHLFERDCSIQRRHQKVVEMAPSRNLPDALRQQICDAAVRLAKAVGYYCAGTMEFLVEKNEKFYFIECNPRLQVEHTVTEEITGIDIVQSQIQITSGATLKEIGIPHQDSIIKFGFAVQVRITTEDPMNNFQPDTGKINFYQTPGGKGLRLDGGPGYTGAVISPHYDSLLVKITAHDRGFFAAIRKLVNAISEVRIRGVKTNIPFLINLLQHPKFLRGESDTQFIEDCPELLEFGSLQNKADRILLFLANAAINNVTIEGTTGEPGIKVQHPPKVLAIPQQNINWRAVLKEKGIDAFLKEVRQHQGLLLTDTTWRDAHQSLLMTRVRTYDLVAAAPATNNVLTGAFSLEMWGGATFDVCLRFLRECPWQRLKLLRKLVPNIPFQMLLRGANAVGYTAYPDNVVKGFVKKAYECGIDIFRIFDSLNYVENLKLGIDAVKDAGGIAEVAICYSGDILDQKRKFTLQYYLDLVKELVDYGIHILAIKDMAGLLKPQAAKILVSEIRKRYPDLPIHVHTHDTAGTGVASMLACSDAGADIVDCAMDSMSGLTSQPSIGAIVAALAGTPRQTCFELENLVDLNNYWENVRAFYNCFDSGQKSGSSDVYIHEMPGGQYTNLQFQSLSMGQLDRWPAVKHAYAAANRILGDIVKVTPSSKVVGDLAQMMVAQNLTENDVLEKAATLSFPTSVVEFLQGQLGEPYQGFPEPFRSTVLKAKGLTPITGRPGASMADFNFEKLKNDLASEFRGLVMVSEEDLLSAALYPKVWKEYTYHKAKYGDISCIPSGVVLSPMKLGEETVISLHKGKLTWVKLVAIGMTKTSTGEKDVIFEVNGQARAIIVVDSNSGEISQNVRKKADPAVEGSIGAPLSGVIAEIRVQPKAIVAVGTPLVVISAMKLETNVSSPIAGQIREITVKEGDSVSAGDLLFDIKPLHAL